MKARVLAALSGGVDSSVAAHLLVEAGCAVTGVTMFLGAGDGEGRPRCCGSDAVEDAKRVCERLGIEHCVMDFAEAMEEHVIAKFVREYGVGRTPNPCIDCNRSLKFGILLERARKLGFDYLATGHYALIDRSAGRTRLMRPKDRMKDQTYFLYPIRVGDLASILFPLGDRTKEEVKTIARKTRLPVAEKAESQDLCFVTRRDFRRFMLQRGAGAGEGDIVDSRGTILGRHKGIVHYTIGQRSGLGISAKTPLYVTALDPTRNRIVVGQKDELKARGLVAADLNLFRDKLPVEAEAKIRYRKKPSPCLVLHEGKRLRVIFRQRQESITPGQSVVLYGRDEVLGGGVIEEVLYA